MVKRGRGEWYRGAVTSSGLSLASVDWGDGSGKMHVSGGNSSETWDLGSALESVVQRRGNATSREKNSKRYRLGARSGWEHHGDTAATTMPRNRRKYISRRRKRIFDISAGPSSKPIGEVGGDREGS